MKKYILLIIIFLQFPISLHAKIKVFACEPEWESLAKEIGQDKVKLFSATTAKQDPHYISARPSLIAKARSSDLLICSGAGLEAGWLPLLLQRTKKNIQPGKVGLFYTSQYIDILEKPTIIDRSLGDIHPEGNPHVHLSPYNILKIASELTNRLVIIDPKNDQFYKDNLVDFNARWNKSILKWEEKASALKGKNIIAHHKSFLYLLDWLKINELATLESKPGIPPTTSHLNSLLEKSKNNEVNLIIRTPYASPDASNWLSEIAHLENHALSYTVGGSKEATDLFTLYDEMINILVEKL